MAEPADDAERDKAVRRYGALEDQFAGLGGYAAEGEAARICANLGLPDRVLAQTLRHPVRRSAPPRRAGPHPVLRRARRCCSTSRPTTSTPTRSPGCAGFLTSHKGGLIVISHDVELLEAVVNKVWYLDANRADRRRLQPRLEALPASSARPTSGAASRSGPTPSGRSTRCMAQADKMRAKATKAKAAQEHGQAGRAAGRRAWTTCGCTDKVAKVRFPTPAPCGRTPLTAEGLSKSYGSLEIFTDVDLAVDRGTRVVVLGLNGAGKTTLLRMLAGTETPDTGEVKAGHGLRRGLLRAGARDARHGPHAAREHALGRAGQHRHRAAADPRRVPVLRRDVDKRAGMLSGGEKTRLALATLVVSGANVLLLDEPTNNLDPVSREQVLDALRTLPRRDRAGHPRRGRGARRSSRTRRSCCPTAPRTPGARTSPTWSARLTRAG